MHISYTKTEIFKAMNLFRQQVKQPTKSADNPYFKSKYVDLDGVVKAIDEGCKGTGLSFIQETTSGENEVAVKTIILHESGEYLEFEALKLPTSKRDAQAFGSATTYAKRYSLSAAFGIASDVDDDANDATAKVQQQAFNPKLKYATDEQLNKLAKLAKEYCELKGTLTNEAYQEIKSLALKNSNVKDIKIATFEQLDKSIVFLKNLIKAEKKKQTKNPELDAIFDNTGNPI